jgi:dynein heavy chain
LTTYKKILIKERADTSKSKRRYERGLKILETTASVVADLKEELTVKQPALEVKQGEIKVQKVQIEKDTEEADKIKSVVVVEAEEAAKQAAEVKAVKDVADGHLKKAEPMLADAIKKVDMIDVKDFYVIKGMKVPAAAAVALFKIVCFFICGHNCKPPKPKAGSAEADSDPEGFFAFAKKQDTLLNNPNNFLKQLKTYPRDSMPEELIRKVSPLMEEEIMAEAKVKNASSALLYVRVWVVAMITYYETLKVVNPLRSEAAAMDEKLKIVQDALAVKTEQVRVINENLDRLNKQLSDAVTEGQQLQDDLEMCSKMLYRADKMIGGLAGEKARWTQKSIELGEKQNMINGDCLLASGLLSYGGPFISNYRESLEELWRNKIKEVGVKITPGITMKQLLGNPIEIRSWSVSGLPGDNLSVENGIIMFNSRRWPLMIDPQT